jgi:hypothetical protein
MKYFYPILPVKRQTRSWYNRLAINTTLAFMISSIIIAITQQLAAYAVFLFDGSAKKFS